MNFEGVTPKAPSISTADIFFILQHRTIRNTCAGNQQCPKPDAADLRQVDAVVGHK
jgi:hypothetical protein